MIKPTSLTFTTADTRDPGSSKAESFDLEIDVPKLSQLTRADSLHASKPQAHKSEGQILSCSASLSDPQSPSSERSGMSKEYESSSKKKGRSSSRGLASSEQKSRPELEKFGPSAVENPGSGPDFNSCEVYSSTSEQPTRSESNSNQQQRLRSFRVSYSLNYRSRFFSRVFHNNKMLEERIFANKKAQTVIVIDWDDTVICTSYLESKKKIKANSIEEFDKRTMDCLAKLDRSANALFEKALQFGNPVILTNACQGWVDLSAERLLPKTRATILKRQVQCVSARDRYESVFPNDEYAWKRQAFIDIARPFSRDFLLNLVVIGDSDKEHEAGKHLKQLFPKCFLKSIHFLKGGDLCTLIRQQDRVTSLLPEIFAMQTDFEDRMSTLCKAGISRPGCPRPAHPFYDHAS